METIPDYRPKDIVNEKNQKTTTNQSTKFHQLQQMFGNLTSSNEVAADIPLYKQLNSIGDNINTENEVSFCVAGGDDGMVLHIFAVKTGVLATVGRNPTVEKAAGQQWSEGEGAGRASKKIANEQIVIYVILFF